jgi:hypothetical protein
VHPEVGIAPLRERVADEAAVLGEQALALEVVERGEQSVGGEVAGAADDDDVLVAGPAEPGLAVDHQCI